MTETTERQTVADSPLAEAPGATAPHSAHIPNATLHRIVVVGGGAAGLELVTRLGHRLGRRKRASVALVDSARTHLWKPMLHAAAAGSIDPGAYEVNYLAHARWNGFAYHVGEMTGIDRARREVHLAATVDEDGQQITPARSVGYDTLVISIGSITNDFGTPGVAEHAVPLETTAHAQRFNRRLLNAYARAQTQRQPILPGQLHVAIVGAGATGTELAAELHRTTRELVAYGLDRIDPQRDIRIVLLEGAPRVLAGLPERISKAAHQLLEKLGVEIHVGAKVTEVTAQGINLADGSFIAAELVVWAAGVKGPDVLRQLDGLETNRINQLIVQQTLQTTRDPAVFAMGDCAACPRSGTSAFVPPRAQAAHQEAAHMVRQIERRLRKEPLEPYAYRDFGSLVSIGKWSTVGNLMGALSGGSLFVEGVFAGLMYRALRFMHERAVNGTVRAMLGVLARTAARRNGPQLKLH